jgi:DNA uptake protein ComE-like DNA-binding protein
MFRKDLNPAAAVCLLALFGAACAGQSDSADSEAPAEETTQPMTTVTAAAPATMAGLANPNLASEEELAAVPGLAGAAAAVVDNRPYLRAADVHTVLMDAVGEEAALAAYEHLWLRINLNDVTNDEVLLIPGVGDRMAHEFEEYRPYEDMDEFRREIGKYVDEDEVARLEQYVYLPIDLNAATRDEIMAIPGMTDRMAHEFEEYRPYTDLDQFRREIGKYVDEGEVARLERYVTLN